MKLIDFGFSVNAFPRDKLKVFCGTPSYMAPEIVQKKEYTGQSIDVWALGVILYTLLAGFFPFRGQSEKDLFRKISRGLFQMPDCISIEAKRVLTKLLTIDPAKRPTAHEVSNRALAKLTLLIFLL